MAEGQIDSAVAKVGMKLAVARTTGTLAAESMAASKSISPNNPYSGMTGVVLAGMWLLMGTMMADMIE